MKKILIMGLPGVGKTTLAEQLIPLLKAKGINNDEVRKAANDWDFSEEGRNRQAKRMANEAEKYRSTEKFVVCDFICPTPQTRELFNADFTICVDNQRYYRFEDTNALFVKPDKVDFHVINHDFKNWANQIIKKLQ